MFHRLTRLALLAISVAGHYTHAADLNIDGNGSFSGDAATSGSLRATKGLTIDGNTLYVDPVQNRVGIGTTTPIWPFEVVGPIQATTNIRLGWGINANEIARLSNPYIFIGQCSYAGTETRKNVVIRAGGGDRITIMDVGCLVGINTPTPVNTLSVNGAAAIGAAYNATNLGVVAPANGLIVAGNVGIGTTDTLSRLTVQGNARIKAGCLILNDITTAPTQVSGAGLIYAKNSSPTEVFVRDSGGQITQLSSHRDPRSIAPSAQTSFADSKIALPYSFHHQNALLGKGEVVDMAKLVAYVEKKMQAELGSEAGRLVYLYDLPTSETLTPERLQVEKAAADLATRPWIKVALGSNGEIPAEAVEEVAETNEVMRRVSVSEKVVDFDTLRLKTVTQEKEVPVIVPTGKTIKRFKKSWKLSQGELYRRPTVADLNLQAIADKQPDLPLWVRDRLTTGTTTKASLTELSSEVKQAVETMRSGE